MPLRPEYRVYLIDLFATFGTIGARRVFGFTGLFAGEVMFGLVADERIYLKTDEKSRKDYEAEGSEALRLRPRPSSEMVSTSYFALPERLYDEPEELALWARRAYDAAAKSPHSRKKKRMKKEKRGARQPLRRQRRS
jgi:DNA transformation protein